MSNKTTALIIVGFVLVISATGLAVNFLVFDSNNGSTGIDELGFCDDVTYEGSGAENSPYQVTSFDQLQCIENNDLSGRYILMNDLNGNNVDDYRPIGNDSILFNGEFDGKGHSIKDLNINSQDYTGVFGGVGENGYVHDLNVVNSDVDGGDSVGLIAGVSNGDLENVNVDGTVTGDTAVGGIVGRHLSNNIENSNSSVTVNGGSYTGGAIGLSTGDVINVSVRNSVVDSGNGVGGLIGFNPEGTTDRNSVVNSEVNGDRNNGGLIGNNEEGEVTESYVADTTIEGRVRTGGLIGSNRGDVRRTYNTNTNINGESITGGLIGYNEGSVTESYAFTSITGGDRTGGLIGVSRTDTVQNSYWNTGSGVPISEGGSSIPDTGFLGDSAEQKMTGFDFDNTWSTVDNEPPLLK